MKKPIQIQFPLPVLNAGLMIAFAFTLGGIAVSPAQQANLIQAIGQISSGGNVVASANTVNGVLTSSRPGTGDYTITLSAPGAFAGSGENDYLIEVTIRGTSSNDEIARASVTSRTDDELEIRVRVADIEDDTNGNTAAPANRSFFFSIYRSPSEAVSSAGETRFLQALGTVDDDGSLESSLAVDGISVASSQTGTGAYEIVLSKTGAFADDSSSDYVIILSVTRVAHLEDEVIRGGIGLLGSNSDNQVVIQVYTDDAQAAADSDNPTPDDQNFAFTIYRIPSVVGNGLARSRLLTALANVGGAGNLVSGTNFIEGGSPIQTSRTGEGEYTILVQAPGAFADMEDDQYVVQVHLNQSGNGDEFISAEAFKNDDDSLTIEVATNDIEQSGSTAGQLSDANFFCLVYDTRVNPQPDLRIGTKKNLSKQKGNDIYNGNGAGQKIKAGLINTTKKKYHLSMENDGNFTDDISLKANKSGKKIRMKYFQTTGGRKNVTAKVLAGTHVAEDVRPGKIIRYEAQAKYLNQALRPKKMLRYKARSGAIPSRVDANKARIVPQ